MDELSAILDRIDALTGPDRGVDQDLFCALGLAPADEQGIVNAARAPAYTASLDATVALIRQVLPGWAWSTGECFVSDDGWVKPDYGSPKDGARLLATLPHPTSRSLWDDGFWGDRATVGHPAIALLGAFVEGVIAARDAATPPPAPTAPEPAPSP
jgi:hypothetical protein